MTRVLNSFFSLLILFPFLATAQNLNFHGQFEDPAVSSKECENIFVTKRYWVRHYAVGATGLTSVVNFRVLNEGGFFDNLSFVGQTGGGGDIKAEKELVRDGFHYSMVLEGLIDPRVFVVKMQVQARKSKAGEVVCTAESQYSGFNN